MEVSPQCSNVSGRVVVQLGYCRCFSIFYLTMNTEEKKVKNDTSVSEKKSNYDELSQDIRNLIVRNSKVDLDRSFLGMTQKPIIELTNSEYFKNMYKNIYSKPLLEDRPSDTMLSLEGGLKRVQTAYDTRVVIQRRPFDAFMGHFGALEFYLITPTLNNAMEAELSSKFKTVLEAPPFNNPNGNFIYGTQLGRLQQWLRNRMATKPNLYLSWFFELACHMITRKGYLDEFYRDDEMAEYNYPWLTVNEVGLITNKSSFYEGGAEFKITQDATTGEYTVSYDDGTYVEQGTTRQLRSVYNVQDIKEEELVPPSSMNTRGALSRKLAMASTSKLNYRRKIKNRMEGIELNKKLQNIRKMDRLHCIIKRGKDEEKRRDRIGKRNKVKKEIRKVNKLLGLKGNVSDDERMPKDEYISLSKHEKEKRLKKEGVLRRRMENLKPKSEARSRAVLRLRNNKKKKVKPTKKKEAKEREVKEPEFSNDVGLMLDLFKRLKHEYMSQKYWKEFEKLAKVLNIGDIEKLIAGLKVARTEWDSKYSKFYGMRFDEKSEEQSEEYLNLESKMGINFQHAMDVGHRLTNLINIAEVRFSKLRKKEKAKKEETTLEVKDNVIVQDSGVVSLPESEADTDATGDETTEDDITNRIDNLKVKSDSAEVDLEEVAKLTEQSVEVVTDVVTDLVSLAEVPINNVPYANVMGMSIDEFDTVCLQLYYQESITTDNARAAARTQLHDLMTTLPNTYHIYDYVDNGTAANGTDYQSFLDNWAGNFSWVERHEPDYGGSNGDELIAKRTWFQLTDMWSDSTLVIFPQDKIYQAAVMDAIDENVSNIFVSRATNKIEFYDDIIAFFFGSRAQYRMCFHAPCVMLCSTLVDQEVRAYMAAIGIIGELALEQNYKHLIMYMSQKGVFHSMNYYRTYPYDYAKMLDLNAFTAVAAKARQVNHRTYLRVLNDGFTTNPKMQIYSSYWQSRLAEGLGMIKHVSMVPNFALNYENLSYIAIVRGVWAGFARDYVCQGFIGHWLNASSLGEFSDIILRDLTVSYSLLLNDFMFQGKHHLAGYEIDNNYVERPSAIVSATWTWSGDDLRNVVIWHPDEVIPTRNYDNVPDNANRWLIQCKANWIKEMQMWGSPYDLEFDTYDYAAFEKDARGMIKYVNDKKQMDYLWNVFQNGAPLEFKDDQDDTILRWLCIDGYFKYEPWVISPNFKLIGSWLSKFSAGFGDDYDGLFALYRGILADRRNTNDYFQLYGAKKIAGYRIVSAPSMIFEKPNF
jgi:hypothetical protein